MRMLVWIILVLGVTACRKAPTEPSGKHLEDYAGTFTGLYQELICAIPSLPETEIDRVQAVVVAASPNWLSLSLIQPNGDTMWSLNALYSSDSTFFIVPFDRGGITWSGNVHYDDQFTIALGNRSAPCVVKGNTLATIAFRAPR